MGAKLVILYGSRARGDYTEESDVDILVVGDSIPKDPRTAYSILIDSRYPRVQPIGFNTEVFLNKLREGCTFILEILEDGKILYANEEFLALVNREFSCTRSRYKRAGKTWIKIT